MQTLRTMVPPDWNPRKDGVWIPSPETEAEAGAYRLPDGQLGMPAAAVFKALVTAALPYPAITAQGKALRKSSANYVAGSLHMLQELFPLYSDDGEPINTYVIDVRRARPQRTGGSVLRARGRVDLSWALPCVFGWTPQVSEDLFRTIGTDAGLQVGLGNYRPELKGWFGKFHLSELAISQN